jgi:hypothetical protein
MVYGVMKVEWKSSHHDRKTSTSDAVAERFTACFRFYLHFFYDRATQKSFINGSRSRKNKRRMEKIWKFSTYPDENVGKLRLRLDDRLQRLRECLQ